MLNTKMVMVTKIWWLYLTNRYCMVGSYQNKGLNRLILPQTVIFDVVFQMPTDRLGCFSGW